MGERCDRSSETASSPPADAPIPTIARGSASVIESVLRSSAMKFCAGNAAQAAAGNLYDTLLLPVSSRALSRRRYVRMIAYAADPYARRRRAGLSLTQRGAYGPFGGIGCGTGFEKGLTDFKYANSAFMSESLSTAMSYHGIGGRMGRPTPRCLPVRIVLMN